MPLTEEATLEALKGSIQKWARIVPPLPQSDSKPKSRPRLVYGKPQD